MNVEATKSDKGVLLTSIAAVYILPAILFGVRSFLPGNEMYDYVFTILGSLLMAAIALWAITNDTVSFQEIGFTKKHLFQAVWIIGLGWAIWGLITTYNFRFPESDSPMDSLLRVLQQWLFVGMAEELFIRGYVLTKITKLFPGKGKFLSYTLVSL
jgi:membrane protease YdiL (CAAX protease family)